MDEIYAIEDGIRDLVCQNEAGHYLASESHNGERKIMFYLNNKDVLEQQVTQLQQKFTSHKIKYKITFDPFWVKSKYYF